MASLAPPTPRKGRSRFSKALPAPPPGVDDDAPQLPPTIPDKGLLQSPSINTIQSRPGQTTIPSTISELPSTQQQQQQQPSQSYSAPPRPPMKSIARKPVNRKPVPSPVASKPVVAELSGEPVQRPVEVDATQTPKPAPKTEPESIITPSSALPDQKATITSPAISTATQAMKTESAWDGKMANSIVPQPITSMLEATAPVMQSPQEAPEEMTNVTQNVTETDQQGLLNKPIRRNSSISSLLSAYSRSSTDSVEGSSDSNRDSHSTKDSDSPQGNKADSAGAAGMRPPAPLDSVKTGATDETSRNHTGPVMAETGGSAPPVVPVKDTSRTTRPRTPSDALRTTGGDLRTSSPSSLTNGSPQRREIWRRRASSKSDRSIAVAGLKLAVSHGSTAATTSQAAPAPTAPPAAIPAPAPAATTMATMAMAGSQQPAPTSHPQQQTTPPKRPTHRQGPSLSLFPSQVPSKTVRSPPRLDPEPSPSSGDAIKSLSGSLSGKLSKLRDFARRSDPIKDLPAPEPLPPVQSPEKASVGLGLKDLPAPPPSEDRVFKADDSALQSLGPKPDIPNKGLPQIPMAEESTKETPRIPSPERTRPDKDLPMLPTIYSGGELPSPAPSPPDQPKSATTRKPVNGTTKTTPPPEVSPVSPPDRPRDAPRPGHTPKTSQNWPERKASPVVNTSRSRSNSRAPMMDPSRGNGLPHNPAPRYSDQANGGHGYPSRPGSSQAHRVTPPQHHNHYQHHQHHPPAGSMRPPQYLPSSPRPSSRNGVNGGHGPVPGPTPNTHLAVSQLTTRNMNERPVTMNMEAIAAAMTPEQNEQINAALSLFPRQQQQQQQSSSLAPESDYQDQPLESPASPIIYPAPPLTEAHYSCHAGHTQWIGAKNSHYSLACQTCGAENRDPRKVCAWCHLRICFGCQERLTGPELKGDLRGLMGSLRR